LPAGSHLAAVGDLYTDDLSTDFKTAAPKLVNSVGNRAGEVARGFLNTHVSCRVQVVERLMRRGLAFLNERYREFAESAGAKATTLAGRRYAPRLPTDQVEFYSHIPAIFTRGGVFRALFLRCFVHRVAALREEAGSSLRVRCSNASPNSLREGART
jgi:hypothetical protein